jgi:hypothetical protein
MKPHKPKNRYKIRLKNNKKIKGDKNQIKKDNKTLNQKVKRGKEFFLTKDNKRKELKIRF